TCSARATPSCVKGLASTNTGATPAAYETCAKDVAAADCATVLPHAAPASCRPTGGKVAAGGACGDDWQCAGGCCAISGDAVCGTCATRGAPGATCTDDENCDFGLVCAGEGGSKHCVAPGKGGDACDANHPCTSPNVCSGTTVTAQGTCAPAAAPGGSCAM